MYRFGIGFASVVCCFVSRDLGFLVMLLNQGVDKGTHFDLAIVRSAAIPQARPIIIMPNGMSKIIPDDLFTQARVKSVRPIPQVKPLKYTRVRVFIKSIR